jgi:hypothetical protein
MWDNALIVGKSIVRNMTNQVITLIVSFIVIMYLIMGATFYVNDVRYSRTAVHMCPPGVVTEPMQDCPPQIVSLKGDWPTAITITVGWLPLLIMRGIER